MTAITIDGTAIAKQLRVQVANRAASLNALGKQPGLAVVLVGDDPASAVYVRNKVKACEEAGIRSVLRKFDAELTEAELLSHVDALNADATVHGILVQIPLPKHINAHRVIERIAADKDVDGYGVLSAGQLAAGLPGFKSCTPWGAMKLIESTGVAIAGKHAVVIGRSNTVGKPMALMLLQANATVTICHSGTPNLATHTAMADIVVAAVGRRNMVTGSMLKPGAVVIDVGINRVPEGEANAGKLCGDVDFASCAAVAGHITPVPGGVGPMTIATLLTNTLDSAELKAKLP